MTGVGAELTGGNFFKGMTVGLMVSALNHAAHKGNWLQQKSANNISQEGLEFIAEHEGFEPNVYYVDGRGNPTIGYGHELLPGEDFSGGITKEQGLELLRQDAQKAVRIINRNVKVSLNQHQFDALVSYVFNTGSLYGTKLLSNLNSFNFIGAAKQMDINTSGGIYMQGLENRRILERNLFLNGVYK